MTDDLARLAKVTEYDQLIAELTNQLRALGLHDQATELSRLNQQELVGSSTIHYHRLRSALNDILGDSCSDELWVKAQNRLTEIFRQLSKGPRITA
jgi:hypothetical protein